MFRWLSSDSYLTTSEFLTNLVRDFLPQKSGESGITRLKCHEILIYSSCAEASECSATLSEKDLLELIDFNTNG